MNKSLFVLLSSLTMLSNASKDELQYQKLTPTEVAAVKSGFNGLIAGPLIEAASLKAGLGMGILLGAGSGPV